MTIGNGIADRRVERKRRNEESLDWLEFPSRGGGNGKTPADGENRKEGQEPAWERLVSTVGELQEISEEARLTVAVADRIESLLTEARALLPEAIAEAMQGGKSDMSSREFVSRYARHSPPGRTPET